VRDGDGLALSSRNVRLGPDERARARRLPRALERIRTAADAGETDASALVELGREVLGDLEVDYLAVVDPETLEPLERVEGPALVCAAVRVGATRLIDNVTTGRRQEA
jgi:pantoate--beta-alanine ligase